MMERTIAVLLSTLAFFACAQSVSEGQSPTRQTEIRGYWTDSSTGLMWAGKDNGTNANWHQAVKYCRNLRLGGYSDWRLPMITQLEGIYDESANAPGLAGPKGSAFTWHVKGNLFLTGVQWSISQRQGDRGQPNGLAWFFDFNNGIKNDDDAGRFTGRLANYGRRALCVRGSEN